MAKANAGKAVQKKAGGREVAAWEEELKRKAAEESDRTPVGAGNQISVRKNGEFRHQGADVGNEIQVIVVDHVFMNQYFDSPFDEDNPSPPACYAVSAKDKNMAPVDGSPVKQSPGCDGCWANEWKSDDRGRGKACGNKKRLAVVFADDVEGELSFLTVAVTSAPNFNKYVKKLNDASGLPVSAVVTKVGFDDSEDYQKLTFVTEDRLDRETYNAIQARVPEARAALMAPPDFSGYSPPKGRGSKAARPAAKGGAQREEPRRAVKAAGRSRLS